MAFSPEPVFGKFAQSKSKGNPAYLQKKKTKNPVKRGRLPFNTEHHERCAGAAFTAFSLPVLIRLLISVYEESQPASVHPGNPEHKPPAKPVPKAAFGKATATRCLVTEA